MRKLSLLLFASLFFIAADCERTDPNSGQLSLNFTSTYQDEPLVMYDATYSYPDGAPVKFQLFNYYVSDVSLIREDDPEGPGEHLAEVLLVDFSEILTPADATAGLTFHFDQLPIGKYTGIRLGLGIAPELNATQPGDYNDPNHPLARNWWSWARGYVFTKIEGNADVDGDGVFNTKLTYHVGDNSLYRELTFHREIVVSERDQNLHFNVDLYDMLNPGNEYLDISQTEFTQDHTNNEAIYGFLWDNLVDAFTLQP
jgi:hypothetical protein